MCFFQAVSVMAFPYMHFVRIRDKSTSQNQFERMALFFRYFKKYVIVIQVSLNDPDWPHFSAWPTMASFEIIISLTLFCQIG